jgi:Uma2 family endonuclease
LIDGEHYVTPSPNLRHQEILGRLHLLIGVWLERHPRGRLFFAPLDVILSHFDVVEPDLLYASHERAREIMTGNWVRGAPELVVEIGSPSTRTRDETLKRRLYEQFGVVEYWVVDPEAETIRAFRRAGETFGEPVELTRAAGGLLRSELFPGLELPLARVFESSAS